MGRAIPMITLQWEDIGQAPCQAGLLQRARVPGGWLVRETLEVAHNLPEQGYVSGWEWRTALAYIPDPDGRWGRELGLPLEQLG